MRYINQCLATSIKVMLYNRPISLESKKSYNKTFIVDWKKYYYVFSGKLVS